MRAGSRRRTLTWKLAAVIVGVTAAALVLSGVVALALVRESVTDTAVNDVSRQAEQLGEGIAELGGILDARGNQRRPSDADLRRPPRDSGSPNAIIARIVFAGLFGDEAAGIYEISPDGSVGAVVARGPGGSSGQSVVDLGLLDSDALLAGEVQRGTTTFEGQSYAWAAARTQVESSDLAVVLAAPIDTSGLWGPGLAGTGTLLIAGLVALAIAAAASVLLARRLTRPVASLTDATLSIAAGDYSQRVEEHGDDELGDLAHAFNRMTDDLERAREAERSFLMLVSHDLRTPLTAIKGYAEAIADGAVKGDGIERAADVIGSETARLERLVQDLLDLARFDAKEFRLHPEPIDVDRLLSDLASAYAPRAENAEILFTSERDAGLPVTVTDPDRLAQIVRNLLENGLRYVPSGCALSLTWRRADAETIEIGVADTGSGIAAEDLPHVFERLYMAKRYPGERRIGSGLGLAIVADLTHALGGAVSVSSEVGSGTVFSVRLPVVAPDEFNEVSSEAVGSMDPSSWPTSSPRSAERNETRSSAPESSARETS